MNFLQQAEQELAQRKKDRKKIRKHLIKQGYSKRILKRVEKVLKPYHPDLKLLKNVKYIGSNILRILIREEKFDNQYFTMRRIKNIGNELTKYLEKKHIDGKLSIAVDYGKLKWRSGYFTDIGENVSLYSPADSNINVEEPKSIPKFVMYLQLTKKQGGTDKFNDCLYNCLKQQIFTFKEYFDTAPQFKKYLGVKRFDKVDISLIPKVEQKLKTYQINVRGDYVYSSQIKSEKIINLLLQNGHYTVDETYKKANLVKNISYTEKQLLLYDKETYEGYDGLNKWKLTKDEVKDIKYGFKSKYIIILRDDDFKKMSMEEEYKIVVNIANKLKESSKGLINLYKTGSYKDSALDLFDRTTKCINEPSEILQDEAIWIKKSSIGALIWCEQFEGELYQYDVKSLYPYLMSLYSLKFPLKRGEFETLLTLDNMQYYTFGIYRCIIHKSDDKNINKLFRFNDSNYYTSISLTHAKSLNLKIELIQDNTPNFLHYSREKLITFGEVFKPFVDVLYTLKEQNIDKSKSILNILWGALGEIDKRKYYDEYINEIPEDEEILEIHPSNINDANDVIITAKINKRYKTNYARLKPFLLAKGRSFMSDMMFLHRDNIKRILTDGFLTTTPIHMNINVKMGELKYEGYTKSGIIEHCNNRVEVEY
jgi:hypothetical protein